MHHARRHRAFAHAAVLVALLATAGPVRGDAVRVEAVPQGDGGRVSLIWPAPVDFAAESRDGRLYLRFDRPAEGDFWSIRRLRRLVGLPTTADGGRTLVFALKRGVTALAYGVDGTVVLEFARLDAQRPAGAAPAEDAMADEAAAAQPAATEPAPKIGVRTGQHPGYSRVVFDWKAPVGYAVERANGTAVISFDRPAEIDARLLRRKYLKYVRGGTSERHVDRTRVTLQIADGSAVRDMREGSKVVIDVLAPAPADTAAALPPADTADITTPEPAPSQPEPPPPLPAPAAQSEAARQQPAASEAAPDPQPPRLDRTAQRAVLRLDWDRPVAAAVFRRGEIVWCVFDLPSVRDTAALAEQAGSAVRRIDQRPHDHATVLRLETVAGLNPQVERDGLAWLVRFVVTPTAGEAIVPEPRVAAQGGARLLLPVAEPGEPLAVGDPVARETMIVVPVMPLAGRIARTWIYPQFRLPETAQGIVVQPSIDTLRVRALRDGVEIDSVDGLALSPAAAGAAPPDRPDAGERLLLDSHGWQAVAGAGFVAQRQALERAVADATAGEREQKRLRLAQFLLAERFATEALGVLQVAAAERPALATEPSFLLLRGAARLLTGRLAEARTDLGAAAASGAADAMLWASAAQAASGEPVAALDDLPRWTAIVQTYPPGLLAPLTALLAEAAIGGGKLREAQRLIEAAKPLSASNEARARLAYLDGRRRQAAGDVDGALAGFEAAARLDPRRGRAQAELARTQLLLKAGRIAEADAIASLDALRFAWRGDDAEFAVLRELGRLQLQAGDYAAGLRTLKQAVGDFSTLPGAQDATREMAQAFEALYLGDAADRLPPVTALGLYDEFKELTPPGEKGRRMVRRLADRLAGVDLLDRAATLLEGLLPSAATAAERADLGGRLAEFRLLDGKPEAALDTLRRTTAAGDAPADLQRARALLQARALAALRRDDEALAALGHDDGLDAELLRAKIFRSKGDWGRAATALRRLVEAARGAQAGELDERQARDILDLAVALTLAGSDPQLAQLDDEYRRAMATTPLRDAFRLIAGTVPSPDANAAALAELVEKAMAFRRSLAPAAGAAGR